MRIFPAGGSYSGAVRPVSECGVSYLLITREMDYTLRVLRALYREGQLSAASVARLEHMPKAITLKVLNQLHAVGIVESRRGVCGGYFLRRPCEELTLYDLFRASGDEPLLNRCQQREYQCENLPREECAVCRELDRVQEILNAELRRTPLSELFA